MKKTKLILHIPHSSTRIPFIMKNKIRIPKKEIDKENLNLSDLFIDKIFRKFPANKIIFKYSRIFCDVERFKDSNKEPMSKRGMGVIYTHLQTKKQFLYPTLKYKNKVLRYYENHHKKVDDVVDKILENNETAIIIDAHSFSDEMVYNVFKLTNNPDICIGIDKNFEDKELTKLIIEFFRENGYVVKVNYPYKGTFVSTRHYINKDYRVKSIMIEINKRLYLENNVINKIKFNILRKDIEKLGIIINKYLK